MMKKIFMLLVFVLIFPFAQKTNASESLQQLIDATPSSGVLQLESKKYDGPARITKPITIVGKEGTVIQSETIGFAIENIGEVVLQQMAFSTIEQPLQANTVSNLSLEQLRFSLQEKGIELKKITRLQLKQISVVGLKEEHFSKKPNGFGIYESNDIEVDNVTVENAQDGIYFERIANVTVKNTTVDNGRYGLHFMYGDNIKLHHNIVSNNVTGLMLMIVNGLEVTDNEIVRQLTLNSNGVYLYDVTNGRLERNTLKENTVATVWNRVSATQFEHNVFQSNGTVFESERSPEVVVQNNEFQGNILVARSDKRGFVLQNNTYDDYDGYDFNEDGIGDTPHQTYTSFGQWMVRKPVYQYFIESPSVVLLNKMDHETTTTEDELLIDSLPKIAAPNRKPVFNIAWWQFIIGLTSIIVITYGWRKLR